MQFIIGGLKKTSLLDYPDKISAIIFTQGCNFNCGYCHNPELLKLNSKNDSYNTDSFFEFLASRKNKLDGVVITGGEPTLQPALKLFIQKIKELGFLVKLDTNGSNPDILQTLISENLTDYIAMDIKAPLDKYSLITGVKIKPEKILSSIKLILNSDTDYEFRTTVLASQLSFEDFEQIGKLINGAERYYLQKFEANTKINDECLRNEKSYKEEEFKRIISLLQRYVKIVELR